MILSTFSCTYSVQFSCSVMSNSLQPHELQHARLLYPSPTPRACSNLYPSSWWCHPAISSSVVPFSSCPQSLPALGSFPKWLLWLVPPNSDLFCHLYSCRAHEECLDYLLDSQGSSHCPSSELRFGSDTHPPQVLKEGSLHVLNSLYEDVIVFKMWVVLFFRYGEANWSGAGACWKDSFCF